MKYISITFSSGETYEIPADKIANSRGKYYADKDFGEQGIESAPDPRWTNVYSKERKVALDNNEELIDWAENNVNWEDIEKHRILVDTDHDVSYHDEWASNDKSVVEHS